MLAKNSRMRVPTDSLKEMCQINKLDGIGPAYCGGMDFLNIIIKGLRLIMKTRMEAYVSWVPFEKGGREKPLPQSTKYCPIIIFPNEEMKGTWSAEILINSMNDNNKAFIDLSFLSPDAPFELLKPGAEFELYEGKKLVARGVII